MDLTKNEKDYADEIVFSILNSKLPEISINKNLKLQIASRCGIDMLNYAEFHELNDTSDEKLVRYLKMDNSLQALMKKTNPYIVAEIKRFREMFSSEQRRNFWKYISKFTPGKVTDDELWKDLI